MKIVSIAVSRKKGTRKTLVDRAIVIENHGLEGDAHAGDWHRQVSFLSSESIRAAREKGLTVDFGDFAENVATVGVDWKTLPVGTRVKLARGGHRRSFPDWQNLPQALRHLLPGRGLHHAPGGGVCTGDPGRRDRLRRSH